MLIRDEKKKLYLGRYGLSDANISKNFNTASTPQHLGCERSFFEESEHNLKLKPCDIMEFEENLIASGTCDFILPARLMYEKTRLIINYDAGGYVCLSDFEVLGLEELLELLEKTLINLKSISQYLIIPERVTLNEETIYQNMRNGEVKFIYIPKREESIITGVLRFIGILERYVMPESKRFVAEIYAIIRKYNLPLEDMITLVVIKRRELFQKRQIKLNVNESKPG